MVSNDHQQGVLVDRIWSGDHEKIENLKGSSIRLIDHVMLVSQGRYSGFGVRVYRLCIGGYEFVTFAKGENYPKGMFGMQVMDRTGKPRTCK